METTASLMVEFTADTKDFDKGVKRVDKSLGGLVKDAGKGLKSLGSDISGLGRNLMGMSAPFVAGFGLAVKSAMDFDKAMTNVGAVLGKNKEEMAGLSAEILAIGGASVQGPQAVADAFYDIVGGVSDASLHIPILNQAIALSTAGAADLGASTAALVATMNSYGFEADRASFVSDVFTQTVNKGVGTMDEFAAAFPSVTGMANSMGIELDKLGTYMAFMTTKGVTASEASTMLRGAMSAMLNPTADLQKAISALGYDTGEAMVKAEGLDGALALLKEYNGGTFAGLLTDQEALRAGLILTDDGLADFAVSFGETLDGVTARTEALQLEGAGNQFAKLTSKIGEMGIKIGDALLPVLIQLADAIMPIVTSIVDWIGKNPELTQTIAAVTLGVGALGLVLIPLGAVISGVGTVVGLLGGALGVIVTISSGVIGAIGAIAVAAAPIVAPFLAAAAAVASLIDMLNRLRYTGTDVGAYYSETTIAQRSADANALLNAGQGNVNSGRSNPITGGVNPIFSGLTGKAMGGSARGWTMVGEDGPELVKFGNPATVFSNPSTRGGNNYGGAMMGGGGGVNINGPITINGVQNVQQLFDELRKIGGQRGQ